MKYQNIATNLIIGFLGVGKTTAIRHLLTQVPNGEHWAVLVNEFGEVGIDGALLDADSIAVQEVAGGCLCCVAAGGLQVGLNKLIRDNNPDRIVIEPTGLGHPAQILSRLSAPPYDQVLSLHATIGLVDARQLSDPRYREHPTYQDQIHLADILVGSKADLYTQQDQKAFEQLGQSLEAPKQLLATMDHGMLQKAWLDLPRSGQRKALFPEAHQFIVQTQPHGHEHKTKPLYEWLKIENFREGYHGCGWIIHKEHIFNSESLIKLLAGLKADRVKGVFHTEKGWLSFNQAGHEQEIYEIEQRSDNRLEVIHAETINWSEIDKGLKKAESNAETNQ